MAKTAQSVVVTAQRGLSNCAAVQVRSLEETLVKPTLPQQFLSKELENLQPKTVIEKTNFSVWFLFRQWLFCRQ